MFDSLFLKSAEEMRTMFFVAVPRFFQSAP
jgi:hypothetical protein